MRRIPSAILIWTAVVVVPGLGQTDQQAGTESSRRPKLTSSRRISESPSREGRNTYGFSLGVFGLYDGNVFSSSVSKEGESALMLMPRVYTNFGQGKSFLHLDYQFAERLYPGRRDLDTQNHDGWLEYLYRASRRTTFSLSDRGRYGPNDILAFTSGSFVEIPIGDQGPNQQVFFDRQRMWSNWLDGRLSYKSSRRNQFDAAVAYRVYRYRSTSGEDTDSVRAFATDEYQFSRRWSLTLDASNEWVTSSSGVRDGTILRGLVGLRYRFSKRWDVAGKAGAERVHNGGITNTGGTYEASVSRTSLSNRLEIHCARLSGYQLGLSGLNRTDRADVIFDQRVGRRVSLHLLSRYYRTSGLEDLGKVQTMGGSVGLDYAIKPNIVASVLAHSLYQREGISPTMGMSLNLDRYLVYGGLYFLFPPVRQGARENRQ
jgi:hypothetical protein